MGWHDRLVYYRDFAYSTPRLRMANGNIGHVPAATFAELLSGPMIDIYVGEARRRWTLHRNLLCHHSEQLEDELEGTDTNTRKEALELPEHDPPGFELLVKWLYQGKLDDVSDLPDATQKYEYAVHCHALYLLCERFDLPQLKNVAMDQFRKGLNEAELVPDADEIDDMYRRSPPGSPFRRLMVQIAARQIMDPHSERDTATYRRCLENNADFAIELVNAIRQGTGGMLLADPTDKGNECAYHDHEDGPTCNIKGKGKGRQVRKARAPKPDLKPAQPRSDPSSASSTASTSSGLRSHPPLQQAATATTPAIATTPATATPPPPPRPARPGSSGAGPLLRRLTSPATSTVGTSTETGVASHPPSPDATKDWKKLRKVITPEKPADEAEAPKPPALDEHPPSSDGASRPQPHEGEGGEAVVTDAPRRGIWEWARAGTGRLNIIGRLPHPEWKGPASASKAEGVVVNGVQDHARTTASHDDFAIPSTTATEPDNMDRQEAAVAAKIEGLGISPLTLLNSPNDFSQTKRSSDDLIANASETTGSPSPMMMKHAAWTNGDDTTPTGSKPTSPTTPDTPTPQQRRSDSIMDVPKVRNPHEITSDTVNQTLKNNITALSPGCASPKQHTNNSSTPPKENQATTEQADDQKSAKSSQSANGKKRRVPTYKIALASSLLQPARRSASAAH